jgi:hypothetical protein
MSEMIERVAAAMYWDRVNPEKGVVMLDVAVREWADLPDEHRPGIHVWHCKSFWREAARAAIVALRAPTEAMEDAPWRAGVQVYEPTDLTQVLDCISFKAVWQAMIDEALKAEAC